MNDSMIDKIRYAYWKIIPHDWRPGQIWYRLKCWAWHRYTTMKPRYLKHTWCDRCELLPHMMFEILDQFITDECSPGIVAWYGEEGHKITVNGQEKYVLDEMKDLVAWWHTVWNKEWNEVNDILWAEAHKHEPTSEWIECDDKPGMSYWDPKFQETEDGEIWHYCVRSINKLERIMHKDREERLHRMIAILPYMWT
jgi:hypothetical protein